MLDVGGIDVVCCCCNVDIDGPEKLPDARDAWPRTPGHTGVHDVCDMAEVDGALSGPLSSDSDSGRWSWGADSLRRRRLNAAVDTDRFRLGHRSDEDM